MTDLEVFEENLSIRYHNTKDKVSYGFAGQKVHFQGSVEAEDWWRNLSVLPVPYRVRGVWLWVSVGMLYAWMKVRKKVLAADPQEGVAYSGGAPVVSLWSAETGLPAVAFGSPRFLFRPSARALALFEGVRYVDAPFDVVTMVPPWMSRGGNVYTLQAGPAVKPDGIPWPLWITGHVSAEYRQRLA